MSERLKEKDLPRFSGALRANTDLEAKLPVALDTEEEEAKRQERNSFLKT